jgi:hypothetical protein
MHSTSNSSGATIEKKRVLYLHLVGRGTVHCSQDGAASLLFRIVAMVEGRSLPTVSARIP